MSHTDSPWTRLASRTIRGVLARKGASYDDASLALNGIGVAETPKTLELKTQRGTLKFATFLQLLCVLGADLPPEFQLLVDDPEEWEAACRRFVLSLLAEKSVPVSNVAQQLEACGVQQASTRVESLVDAGTFPLALILQLAHTVPIPALDRFVDRSDIAKAASETIATS